MEKSDFLTICLWKTWAVFFIANSNNLWYISNMVFIYLLILAIITFALGGGAVLYFKMFTRSEKPGIPEIPESFDGEEVEIKGVGNGGTHVHDPIIMKPLLEAKRRWASYPLEKLRVIGVKGILLSADLWLAEDFEKSENRFAILIHGMTDSSSGMAYLAEEYHKLGVNVLAINVRSHGESYGKTYGMGYKDAKDVQKWMELICSKYGEDSKFILHGISMGGATVFNTISRLKIKKSPYEKKVILAVEDCGFSNWEKQMLSQVPGNFGQKGFQKFIILLMIKGMSFWSFIAGNGFMENYSPRRNLAKATKKDGFPFPIIIFHGGNDILVKPETGKELLDSIHNQENKELVLVDGAPHIGAYFYQKELYMKKIKDAIGI